MISDVKLLPCPFCGSPAERIDFGPDDIENAGGSCIACTECQSSGPVEFGRKESFIANWNRRAPEDVVRLLRVAENAQRMLQGIRDEYGMTAAGDEAERLAYAIDAFTTAQQEVQS